MTPSTRIIVALDFAAETEALALVERLDPARCRLKVGKELFTRLGPAFVAGLQGRGFQVFLDLKFHDIPNTVAAACAAAADLGVWMVNVHVAGGPRMLAAARERLDRLSAPPLPVIPAPLLSFPPPCCHSRAGGDPCLPPPSRHTPTPHVRHSRPLRLRCLCPAG